jgi:membrane protease YdiL (CAAX protease family)
MIIRRHPLIAFFVLSYVIAWSPWPFYAAGLLPGTNFLPIAPLIAAIIVAAVRHELRDLGARLIRWRVPWYCYVAAVGVPLAVIFSTAWVNVALGGSDWSLSTFAWADLAILFALRWVNPLDGPLAEEPGWRGFAVPHLQKRWSPLASAAVLGVVVAVWHLPLIFFTEGNPIGWVGLPTTFMVTIWYVWLFNRSRGSVLLTMLSHITQGTIVIGTFGYTGADLDRMLWLGFAAWTLVALAVIVLDRNAWRSPSPTRRSAPRVLATTVVQP